MNVDEESLKRLQNYYLGRTIKLNDKSYCKAKVLDVLSIGLLLILLMNMFDIFGLTKHKFMQHKVTGNQNDELLSVALKIQ